MLSGTFYQTVGVTLSAPDMTEAYCPEGGSVVMPSVDHEEDEALGQLPTTSTAS